MKLNYIDYIIMVAFFAALVIIPAISAARSKSKGANEYFKSAGSMPWWLIGVSMVAASLMGALFSTIAAQLSMGANYITNDIWKRFVRKDAGDRELILVARISSVILMTLGGLMVPLLESARAGFNLMVQIGAGTGLIFLLRWFWMRINAWTEIVAMAVSFLAAVFFELVWPHIGAGELLFYEKLLWTIFVTTIAWLVATFITAPEKPEVIENFKALVRADGRDVGKGLLKMFFASIAIFAFMWAIGALISSTSI